ncbi:unnamed protein product [Brachionus calyciflorus]|uniref:RING-type domain-containing protein n=1 Tax=Brachionus calyciflorus TaxID=104777 RepID=A0A813MS57_9BILA|nr:unnamed protein product [Brachionus calyciflorus]
MLSKSPLYLDYLICSKCDRPARAFIELPCFHIICTQCIQSLKLKFYYHCKKWKLFLKNDLNLCFSKSERLYLKAKKAQKDTLYEHLSILVENLIDKRQNKINFGIVTDYFNCKKCSKRLNSPQYLTCNHILCDICLKTSSNKCFYCSHGYKPIEKDFELDYFYEKVNEFINSKTSDLFQYLEIFFNNFDTKKFDAINFTNCDILLDFLDEKKIIKNAENEINSLRKDLIKKIHTDKNFKIIFKVSDIELKNVQIIGEFKNIIPIINRIKFLQFYPRHNFFDLSLGNEATVINWRPKLDVFYPLTSNKIYFVNLKNSINFDYELKVKNYLNSKFLNCHELNLGHKLEYFKIDVKHNRIVFFLEVKYEQEYVLKIYNINNLKFLCSKKFSNYLDNILFDELNIVTWCSSYLPCLKVYDQFLNELSNSISLSEDLTDNFYSLQDLDDKFLYLNNQFQIGKVCRMTGSLLDMINLENYDSNDLTQRPCHAKSEYLNLKVLDDCLIVATWSKILIFNKFNFNLLVENSIFQIANNDWLTQPNKVFLTRDNYLGFSDNNYVTFI